MIRKFIFCCLLTLIFASSASSQCSCYLVEGLKIQAQDSMLLQLSNACDNNVYLNFYVISSLPPYDTLARQENWAGMILPHDSIIDNILLTSLSAIPPAGTYRVCLYNGNIHCDSVAISPSVGIQSEGSNPVVTVFPNPGEDKYSVDFNGNVTSAEVSLYDGFGRVRMTRKLERINIWNFEIEGSPGLYFLSIKSKQGSSLLRIVKH